MHNSFCIVHMYLYHFAMECCTVKYSVWHTNKTNTLTAWCKMHNAWCSLHFALCKIYLFDTVNVLWNSVHLSILSDIAQLLQVSRSHRVHRQMCSESKLSYDVYLFSVCASIKCIHYALCIIHYALCYQFILFCMC